MSDSYRANKRQIKKEEQYAIDEVNKLRPDLKQQFNDNVQQAYVQKMQAQRDLPQVLAAQGYNGGLTESSNIALNNQYGNAYNEYKRAYDKNLNSLDNQIAGIKANARSQIAALRAARNSYNNYSDDDDYDTSSYSSASNSTSTSNSTPTSSNNNLYSSYNQLLIDTLTEEQAKKLLHQIYGR